MFFAHYMHRGRFTAACRHRVQILTSIYLQSLEDYVFMSGVVKPCQLVLGARNCSAIAWNQVKIFIFTPIGRFSVSKILLL
jgi:hypothetical protein